MEFDSTSKLILAIISAFGTFAAVFLGMWQANRVRAEFLEKFDSSVATQQKHSVTELFRLIHGLGMNCLSVVHTMRKLILGIK